MNQQELNKYFSEEWTDDFDNYTLSGYELAYKCKRTDWVLDVGCGHNPFKGQIKMGVEILASLLYIVIQTACQIIIMNMALAI